MKGGVGWTPTTNNEDGRHDGVKKVRSLMHGHLRYFTAFLRSVGYFLQTTFGTRHSKERHLCPAHAK